MSLFGQFNRCYSIPFEVHIFNFFFFKLFVFVQMREGKRRTTRVKKRATENGEQAAREGAHLSQRARSHKNEWLNV